MAEDVKVLREAAANFEEWFQHGNMQQLWPREQKALSILCTRMADMIEREDAPDVEYDEDGPGHIEGKPAGYAVHIDRVKEREAAAEDRGWNAAIEACWDIAIGNGPVPPTWSLEVAQSPVATKAVQDMSVQVANAIRALRRGAS
jgi:hypothetical protein